MQECSESSFPPTEPSLVCTSPSPAWGAQLLVPESHNAQRYYYCEAPLAETSGVRGTLTQWLGFGRSSQKYRGHPITPDSYVDRVSSLGSRPVCTQTHPMTIQHWGGGSSCAKWGSAALVSTSSCEWAESSILTTAQVRPPITCHFLCLWEPITGGCNRGQEGAQRDAPILMALLPSDTKA